MLNYLTKCILPEGMSKDHRRKLALRSATYSVIGGYLYKKGVDQIIMRCVPDSQQAAVLIEAHMGSFGGHFLGDITSRNISEWFMVANSNQRFISVCKGL